MLIIDDNYRLVLLVDLITELCCKTAQTRLSRFMRRHVYREALVALRSQITG